MDHLSNYLNTGKLTTLSFSSSSTTQLPPPTIDKIPLPTPCPTPIQCPTLPPTPLPTSEPVNHQKLDIKA